MEQHVLRRKDGVPTQIADIGQKFSGLDQNCENRADIAICLSWPVIYYDIDTKYYWKVVATDPSGNTTSDVMNFTIPWSKEWSYSTDDCILDENNGRFCVTPEYPNGTYPYFETFEEYVEGTGPFVNYKRPSFHYLIGKKLVMNYLQKKII